MPRRFDGPLLEQLPAGAVRNADVLNRLGLRTGDTGADAVRQNADHSGLNLDWPNRPVSGDHIDGVRGGEHVRGEFLAAFPNLPDAPHGQGDAGDGGFLTKGGEDAARITQADAGPASALQHFQAEGEYTRHLDHFNSQALTQHADWFMI